MDAGAPATVTIADVRAAAERLTDVSVITPLELSRSLSNVIGCETWLKCEQLQRTGSFKIRGAYNRIALLSDEERARGVVCASAGNHAQGVALASSMLGVTATVYMPTMSPLPKVDATIGYGAKVELVGNVFDEALAAALEAAEASGRVFVHPFDHVDIIAGQGTIGLELVDQLPQLATVVIPVGGGGLIAGIATVLRALRPDVRIIAVQSEGCAPLTASLVAGSPQTFPHADTICDGIAVKRPGVITLPIIEQLVDDVVTVSDAEVARAVTLLLERAKQVVEPSGAVGVAAMLSSELDLEPPAVAVLSGGNIDPIVLHHLITSGLAAEGRYVTLRTRIGDQPGNLVRILELVAQYRANVVGVEHRRLGRRLRLGQVEVVLELEVRGPEHIARLRAGLVEHGYPVTLT